MNLKNFTLILFSTLIALSNIKSRESHVNNVNSKIPSLEFLLDALNFLQQKLVNNTFTDDDLRVLGTIMEFILTIKEELTERQKKEQTVYWLLKQGR